MKVVQENEDILVLRQRPFGQALGGIVFLGFGALPILDQTVIEGGGFVQVATWLVASVFVAMGIAFVLTASVTRIELDRPSDMVTVQHRSLVRSKNFETTVSNISRVAVEGRNDGEGSSYRTKFYLYVGEPIHWSPNWGRPSADIKVVEQWLEDAKARERASAT